MLSTLLSIRSLLILPDVIKSFLILFELIGNTNIVRMPTHTVLCFDGDLPLCRGMKGKQKKHERSEIFWYYPAHSCGPLEALKIETRKNNNPLCRGLEGDPSICRGMTWKKTVLSQMFVMLLNYLEQFWAICTIPVNACEERKNNTPTHIVGVLEKDLSFCRGVIAWLYSI